MKVDTSNWQPSCFGRWQIFLPSEAKITESYEWGDTFDGNGKLEYRSKLNKEAIKITADKREAELRSQKHRTKGDMLLRRIDLPNGGRTLMFWGRPYSEIMYQLDSWLITPEGGVYTYKSEISHKNFQEQFIDEGEKYLAQNLRSRAPHQPPSAPAFCVENGMVMGTKTTIEMVRNYILFPPLPGLSLDFSSTIIGKKQPSLLERTGGLGPRFAALLTHSSTLRRGTRQIGNFKVEELVLKIQADGKVVHSFTLNIPGQIDSVLAPELNLYLNTDVRDNSGQVIGTPFSSDEEALAFWDALVSGLKLHH